MHTTISGQYADATRPHSLRWVAVALALVGWFSITAWVRPLALPDEGRYAGVAWDMFASGQWGVPVLDGMPFFHKPPLYYWLANAAMHMLGVSAFSARLPSVLAASALGCVFHGFAERWQGRRIATTATIVLATTPFFFVGAQFANMDMLVAACVGIAILLAAHHVLHARAGGGAPAALLGAYAACGLGVLAKGLIGAVLPALVILVWLASVRRLRLVPSLVSARGLLLFGAICVPWFIAMQRQFPRFLDYFFMEQHVRRFAGSAFNNHEPLWFAAAALLALCLPWTIPATLGAWRRPRPETGDAQMLRRLMLAWCFVVVGFFSIPQSKLIGYVLPAAAPMAALAALNLHGRTASGRWRAHLRSIAALTALALVMAVGVFALQARHSSRTLGAALASLRQPGEPVIAWHVFPYDLQFYSGMAGDLWIADDWSNPALATNDGWHKELLDAARFAPGPSRLIGMEEVAQKLSRANTGWIIIRGTLPSALNAKFDAREVAKTADLSLWHLQVPGAQR